MFTTTPFFKPREGWLPMPMISSALGFDLADDGDHLAGADVEAYQ